MLHALSGDVRIAYADQGEGEAVLFSPGWACATRRGPSQPRSPGERTRRVLSMDPRGSGDSDTPDSPYTPADHRRRRRHRCPRRRRRRAAHLVGQSMGGMMAQDLALARPERVRVPHARVDLRVGDEWSRGMMQAADDLIGVGGWRSSSRSRSTSCSRRESFRELRPSSHQLEKRLADNPPVHHAYLRQIDYCRPSRCDVAPARGSRSRCLVVAGSHDVLTSAIQNRELAATSAIPRARYEEFEGASHGLIWEETERFAACSTGFLAGASDATRAGTTLQENLT